jgi:hypothetical protein
MMRKMGCSTIMMFGLKNWPRTRRHPNISIIALVKTTLTHT